MSPVGPLDLILVGPPLAVPRAQGLGDAAVPRVAAGYSTPKTSGYIRLM
jgi:hypothetical protein